MSADELIRVITDALFVLVFAGALALAIRDRRRAAFDAALMFGALALVILQGEMARALGLTLPPFASDLFAGALLAVPYLFMRLVDDLTAVPTPAKRGALGGFLLSWVAAVVTPTPLPLPLVAAIVLWFGGFEAYGAILLVREASRTSGVPRRRAEAAALGSLLLGLTLLVAGLQQLVPFTNSITRLLVLGSALSYAGAITPPSPLKRAWLEPELRAFLSRVSAISPREELASVVRALEDGTAQAVGAGRAVVALRNDAGALQLPPSDGMAGALVRAFGEQRALISESGPAGRARSAVVAAPMSARGRRIGALGVELRQAPLFSADDLELVALLGEQAALVLDGARMYADLAAVNRQLEEATRAKTEFLASMSHELRTPLNAVLGFSDLLVEQLGERLTPAQRRYFTNIKDAGNHLLELINEVLDLSKVEAGRLELRPEPVRIGTLVEPVVAATDGAARAAGQSFHHRVAADVVVRLDAGRTRQILYNLLSNAVKFTPRGGRIELTAETRGRDLVVEVSDTGIGIPDDRKDRVFGTFERLHEGRSEASGTGLGLALTKRLVELHGGAIGFESREGHGSTFRVLLPDAVFAPVAGPRLLIVEDDRRDAELLAAIAGQLGTATEIVNTASAARDAIRRDPPFAVVLDLRLPDERGETVLREIKDDPGLRSIRVLVVTVEDDEGRSRPLGADDHLTKPIDGERVSTWMRRVMGLARQVPAAAP